MSENKIHELPLLPLRDDVVLPNQTITLYIGRLISISALNIAIYNGKEVLLVAQKNPEKELPRQFDLYQFGTVAEIIQLSRQPDKTIKIVVSALYPVEIKDFRDERGYICASFMKLKRNESKHNSNDSLKEQVLEQLAKYSQICANIKKDVFSFLNSCQNYSSFLDYTAISLYSLKVSEKQTYLEKVNIQDRTIFLIDFICSEIEMIETNKKINERIKSQIEQNQKEYYLVEQIKAIKKELYGDYDIHGDDEYKRKIDKTTLEKSVKEKCYSELKKMKSLPIMSVESSIIRNYIDCLLSLPWKKTSRIRKNIQKAEEILNRDHYGMFDVKERILEYLSVYNRRKKISGSVLCFVGPPGVGKTSFGKSIARATNRKYIRIALGGMCDEAEIRGHRRTYVGAMPGKVIQKISKFCVNNPLILLDEIDKIGIDKRGDVASALLEVLDSEQNKAFNDHYLEVDFSLSNVMFICTSNSYNISPPLLDRMEIIRIPGYTEIEKKEIAKRNLIPKQFEKNGLNQDELIFTDSVILNIIRFYTREMGVRNLEKQIAKICRKVLRKIEMKSITSTKKLRSSDLDELLGIKKYQFGLAEQENKIGQVSGLAWTEVGGDILCIEVQFFKGKGKVIKTGSLGDIMQESIDTAITIIKNQLNHLGCRESFFYEHDVHIHIPDGATPKDGPSAGIAICTALMSAATKISVNSKVAMTGEVRLNGNVLAIGGLKEKFLAAHRAGIKLVIISKENEKDLREIPKEIFKTLKVKLVTRVSEVFDLALCENLSKNFMNIQDRGIQHELKNSHIHNYN